MDQNQSLQFREKAGVFFRNARQCVARVPAKARILLGLFLIAAVLMAIHTAVTAKNARLHLKLQHDFRNAQVSLWVDDDLAYASMVTGSTRKRFGLIPTDSAQGNLSQIIPVRSGRHTIRLRIEPDEGAMQEDSISGDFSNHTERDLAVSAKYSGLSISWQGSGTALVESSSNFEWLSRYAGSFLLTITGSIISTLAGYAIKELPARLRSSSDFVPKTEARRSVELSTDLANEP